MFRRLKWFVGLNQKNWSTKRLVNVERQQPGPARPNQLPMLDAVHEVAIYIHRFHNLDLFEQGWYKIKVSMRWEDDEESYPGIPARVVQYEDMDFGFIEIMWLCHQGCVLEPGKNVFFTWKLHLAFDKKTNLVLRLIDVVKVVLVFPKSTEAKCVWCWDAGKGLKLIKGLINSSMGFLKVVVGQFTAIVIGHGRVWMIDDTDNSFSTPPFHIKYARQDVFLAIMISFYLSFGEYEGQPSSVILKFELMHAPIIGTGPELQGSLDAYAASVHEYKIPPKALRGLHSYCPVHFDAFHAVLVDTSIHISLLKASYHTSRQKVSSDSRGSEGAYVEDYVGSNKVLLIKALMAAYDVLLEDLRRISTGIGKAIDLTEITFESDATEWFASTPPACLKSVDGEPSLQLSDMTQSAEKSWVIDRRTEWSIWMVYSKVAMPHQNMSNGVEGTLLPHGIHRSSILTRRFTDDPIQTATMRAELHRRGIAQMRINNRSLQDMYIFGDPLLVPIIIVERLENVYHSASVNSNSNLLEDEGRRIVENGSRVTKKLCGSSSQQNELVLRIVVFVHGFQAYDLTKYAPHDSTSQGNHLDLRLVRNQWLLIDPKIQFLMSEANEDKTSGDFREMGSRLAQEVISFLKKKMDKASRSGNLKDIKLSFVGHSIGNLIIRTALTESIMEPYLRYLQTYVSISGPHLGYMYSSNSLFNSGLWILKKFKGTQCIHQLTFTDDPDLENTFIYNLSKEKTLANFRNVLLLSSPQDGYVPYHSARIEPCPASSLDFSRRGKIFMEMLNNCLDQIQACSGVVMRCDINFNTSSYGRNLNTLIGRTAHIEFLESDFFAKFIMWSFPELFR
ncbi:unnamed protein product [Sphenostylis stenocarpa]|uniref:DUF676 domain-containing protein n=1 Tax=Sphenostylis stenocarpa TaxID=92480 RepID=A0AA86VX21_9FABA|nr:unnamed protein product [Sphenostylis stenocarpa]